MKNMHVGHVQAICEICAKVFGNANKLKAHVQAVHYDKRQKCPLCDVWLVFYKTMKNKKIS